MDSSPDIALVNYKSPHESPGPGEHCPTVENKEINHLEETHCLPLDDGRDKSRSKSNSLESLVNPPPPSELGEAESAVLRGDAIGDTAYTQRWVLNTLLTITKALPEYLGTDDEPAEENDKKAEGGEGDLIEMKESDGQAEGLSTTTIPSKSGIVELAEDVENAACQLWDMTAEKDVVLHLLEFGAFDILHLATDIITLSRAPRLTEVVVGVVANICCQAEGCVKVIEHKALLSSCLNLLQSTDDVPTLVECLRLLQLMLWHVTHRVKPEDRSKCPLVLALKGQEALKLALIFILKNSLSDTLLSSLMQFLEALMYIWLPNDQCYMAADYTESGLVEGVVEVMRQFLKLSEVSGSQELPKEVHSGVLILYSFVATPAAHLISSFDQYESLLEPILVSYVEHLVKVEDVEELFVEESSDKLTYTLGLLELLVPTMRHSNILLAVGKLLALTHGATHHYTHRQTSQDSTSDQSEIVSQSTKVRRKRISRSRSRRSRTSQEDKMETDPADHDSQKGESVRVGDRQAHVNVRQVSQEGGSRGRSGSPGPSGGKSRDRAAAILGAGPSCAAVGGDDVFTADDKTEENAISSEDRRAKLHSLRDSVTDYCVRVIKCCPDLGAVLTALNECHAHEVQLFFRVVRSREPLLVGQLQEQLLDTGSHNRLVTILSDMYA
ncbi:uncharacterized protein LOC125042709 [Penaeus chinensis]|uniref:uncharacterized protein LOC125042709 n=1 Tax=Penaeus chinensis TaxID=139456 RepID=UPI001FB69B50|nr:uncharacterized protein LOC125042709 [Penaeus chinensis]XP_047494485.1 uncharacterized protein LOC125042709 [Penaeus chinensis]